MGLPTTERLFWLSGDHTAKPRNRPDNADSLLPKSVARVGVSRMVLRPHSDHSSRAVVHTARPHCRLRGCMMGGTAVGSEHRYLGYEELCSGPRTKHYDREPVLSIEMAVLGYCTFSTNQTPRADPVNFVAAECFFSALPE